jgi:hypothetical protein
MVICFTNEWGGALHELHGFFERVEFEGFLQGFLRCFPGGHMNEIN